MCKQIAPCKECPFRRTSVQGWLGAADTPEEFIAPMWHGSQRQPCHMEINWDGGNIQHQAAQAGLCRGLLIMMKNSCKLPFDFTTLEAMNSTERDTETVFQWLPEFIAHHTLKGN